MGRVDRANLYQRLLRQKFFMSIFEFKLEDHPARQRIRGVMVPIIRDVKAIRVKDEDDGRFYLCGYLNVVTGGCLLYTSPSPRDGLLSRMPSSA